ncbi:hypothetical protein [Phenylobacterium sp.]|nr:hypothetical protein [Phenylobacterium sp.]
MTTVIDRTKAEPSKPAHAAPVSAAAKARQKGGPDGGLYKRRTPI